MHIKSGFLTMLCSAFLWTGCGDSGTNSSPQTGRFKVRMTDAPAQFEAVTVTIAEVSANIGGEWVTIQGNAQTVNLLELSNGKSAVIGEADVPAGQCSQIRLKIEKAEVLADGQTHTVDVSNEIRSGIQVNARIAVNAESTSELVVDFDAHRSVVETGGSASNRFVLQPKLRAVAIDVTGAITGRVSTTVNAPIAIAIAGSDTVTSTRVDKASGAFKLAFLPPGSYRVVVQDTSGAASSNNSVAVSVGSEQNLGTLNLQVGISAN